MAPLIAALQTIWQDALIIAQRDIIRNLRQVYQFLSALLRPLLWLFFLGMGLRPGFTGLPLGINLQQYAFPGIIAMNIMFTGVMSGASIIWDREFGFLKEIQVAPVARLAIAGGKVLGGTVLAVFHGALVLLIYPLLQLELSFVQLIWSLLGITVTSLAATALGVLLASRIKTMEGFGTINNLLVMPLFFLSGALYPTTNIPLWLKYLIYFNPFTYGVDMLRGIILEINSYYLFDLLALTLFTIVTFALTARLQQQSARPVSRSCR